MHIVVGLSGGVDSSVTAYLLKQQGHQVSAIFMQNWENDLADDPHCTAVQDLADARQVCDHLDIPLHTVNFAKEYWDNVFQHCLNEFNAGRTPNPDILCNSEIKFSVFLDYAKKFGAEKIATGHYARIKTINKSYQLYRAHDLTKDQSYFLSALNQHQLTHAEFPLGERLKTDVRQLAEKLGLNNHAKKDSTGICFIGERRFKTFLQEFILAQPGNIETTNGKAIGQHDGIMFYTLGQRKGLQIGGRDDAREAPWYVVGKDISRNVLVVSQDQNHPLLVKRELYSQGNHWISGKLPQPPFSCLAQIRYRQTAQTCQVIPDGNTWQVTFDKPQRAITPGQSVVFYDKDNQRCLGSGIIT